MSWEAGVPNGRSNPMEQYLILMSELDNCRVTKRKKEIGEALEDIRQQVRKGLNEPSERPRFSPSLPVVSQHAEGAWLLEVTMPSGLEVFSKGIDRCFRIESPSLMIDNPMLRDYPSGCPFLAETTLKGLVHAACGYWLAQNAKRSDAGGLKKAWVRLFGSLKKPPEGEQGWEEWLSRCLSPAEGEASTADEELNGGQLRFFPLFFRKTLFRVSNPHKSIFSPNSSRQYRIGTNPIPWECARDPFSPLAIFRLSPPVPLESAESAAERTLMEAGLKFLFSTLGVGAKGRMRLKSLSENAFTWSLSDGELL